MILTNKAISPKGKLNRRDLEKLFANFFLFVAPTLAIFFSLLAQGVPFNKAYPVALLALYQSGADFFKKLNSS